MDGGVGAAAEAGGPGAKRKGRPHVKPHELRKYVVERLQKLGERAKVEEAERLDVSSAAFAKRLKEISGKALWKEVTDAAKLGNIGSSRIKKGGSASASERPTKRRRKAAEAAAALPVIQAPDLGAGAAGWARRCRGALDDAWPRLERHAYAQLSKPGSLGLRSPLELGPGVAEFMASAVAQWIDAALVSCCQVAAGDPTARDGFADEDCPELAISMHHLLRWMQTGGGKLPPPVRWPPGAHARCCREAVRFADDVQGKVVLIEESPPF